MIVLGLGGRKGSGKSELAKVCEKNGFVILSFASELKRLVGEMTDKTIEEVQRDKEVTSSYKFSDEKLKYLSKITEIDINIVNSILKDKEFTTIRQLLQVIGTDLIRKWNSDWHVNQFRKKMKTNVNYCFDDVRFPNEKRFIEEELNGICWFIFRPAYTNISNHESEISLDWTDFGTNIIVNNIPLNSLINRWKYYVQYGLINADFGHPVFECNNTTELREKLVSLLKSLKSIEEVRKLIGCEYDKLMWWINHLVIPYELFIFDDSMIFNEITKTNTMLIGIIAPTVTMIKKDTSFNVTGKIGFIDYIRRQIDFDIKYRVKKRDDVHGHTYEIKIINPFVIENLKKWGIIIGKNKDFLLPNNIIKDDDMIKSFLKGILGSDSCKFLKNEGNPISVSFQMPPKYSDFLYEKLIDFNPKRFELKNGMINFVIDDKYSDFRELINSYY